jgi:secreted trypsin-like serine protease
MLFTVTVLCTIIGFGAARPSAVSMLKPRGPTSRVLGGQEAADGQWPSQLSLEYLSFSTGWDHWCGAVLFNNQYALTAAHCVEATPISSLRIWSGLLHRRDPAATNAQLLPIQYYVMHPNYSALAPGVPNNLAVIRLLDAATITSNTQNALLPPDDSNDYNHRQCYVSGYGKINLTPAMADTLHWAQMPIITNQQCLALFAGVDRVAIFDTHLCAKSDFPDTGPCNGDGGSPIHCYASETDTSTRYVVGLMSWNAAAGGQCNFNYPSVGQRLSKYLDWIHQNTP